MSLIASFDPASKTGWSMVDVVDGIIVVRDSGSFRWDDKTRDSVLERAIAGASYLVVEDCFERKSMRRAPVTNRAHFAAAQKRIGYIMGFAACLSEGGVQTWSPMPSSWRAVLRGAGVSLDFAPREAAKAGALSIARSFGRKCVGARGGDDDDQADAVCIGIAGAVRLAGAELTLRSGG